MPDDLRASLLAIAAQQHGVVAAHQARTLGTRHEVQREFSSSTWRRERSQVFGVAGAPVTPMYRAMLGVLRAGPGAVVSHHSALWLWGVLPEHVDPLHVTRMRAANGSKLKRDGIAPHETRRMPPSHVTCHNAIPVVTPARALADVAATTAMGRVERWLDRCWTMRLVDYDVLTAVLDDLDKPGRRGVRPMRLLVAQRGPGYVPPESGLESRLNWLLNKAGLPAVERQVEVGGERWLGRVDFRLGVSAVVIEVQSGTYHWSLTSADDDRRRSDAMRNAGFVVVPVWESVIWNEPAAAIATIEAAWRELRR